jgi:molybdopterin-containing oxidoreductase family iron-sulfur binding subunit
MKRPPIDPDLLRDRLAAAQGKQYWSSLEQLAGDPAVAEMLQREFPDGAGEWADPISRRRFLTLMGASLALAGLASSGCMRPPTGVIRPYVRQPENLVLGKPLYYATSMSLSGYAVGLLVESHEGRPTKIEGNPSHPASLGAAGPIQQAAVLGLYDPDRAQTVTYRAQPRSWGDVVQELRTRLRAGKRRLAILTEAIGSPTLDRQLIDFLEQAKGRGFEATWFMHEPVNRDNVYEGSRLAFGKVYNTHHDFEKADVVVCFDADFCGCGPSQLADVRGFMKRRGKEYRQDQNPELKVEKRDRSELTANRLYVIETNLSITGVKADHRLAVRPNDVERLLRALAAKLEGLAGEAKAKFEPLGVSGESLGEEQDRFVAALARDLLNLAPTKGKEDRSNRQGHSLILAGAGQPASVHALVHALNARLGNVGQTVLYTDALLPSERPESAPGKPRSLAELTEAIEDDRVDTLLILGGNPAYTAPADVAFASRLEKRLKEVGKDDWLAVHCSPYFDETARLCHWHVPQSHFLETWSDAVAFDGTASVVQPLIAPLYTTKSFHEVIAALSQRKGGKGESEEYDERTGLELVRDYWRDEKHRPPQTQKADFETFWQVALHDGVIPAGLPEAGTPSASIDRDKWPEDERKKRAPHRMVKEAKPTLAKDLVAKLKDRTSEKPSSGSYDVVFAPDPGLYDGRFANLGWLQEWPKPIIRLTWDNAALMSPATAEKLGVSNTVGRWLGGEHGDLKAGVIKITIGKNSLEVPILRVPGHADGAVTLHLGYGRTYAGKVGTKVGVNANLVRPSADRGWVSAKIEKASGRHSLACVQSHHDMEGRDIVRSGTLQEFREKPNFIHEHDENGRKALPTLYNLPEYPGYRWGMAVDLTACVGCGACVVACQSENNIAVVGKEQVLRGREMHWIRVSAYFAMPKGAKAEDVPHSWHFQPVACHHCETAPCEVVCPVEATVHSDEGLNDMVYNRCVGTRYCSHNCPYKVRRFNFLNFTEKQYATPSLKLLQNPDVTVRTRGVMEKCSFCVQRISYARIEAGKEMMDELDKPRDERKRLDANGPDGAPRTQDGKEIPLIHDGEVVSACQAACPADAIVFGDLNDQKSRVRKLHDSHLRYDLLGDHGTRPRLAYLADLRNPNPDLASEEHK